MAMLLRRHNLNLFPILRELLRTRSVSRTAENIGLGQPAVSSALARLREAFDDDLLVQVGRRMELTERARALIEPVERACAELEAAFDHVTFKPETETRRFVIAAADYITFVLAPALIAVLERTAPGLSVQFVGYPPDTIGLLSRGEADLLLIPRTIEGRLAQQFCSLDLFADEAVVISSRQRRPFPGELTRDIYENAAHAMFCMEPKHRQSHESVQLEREGVRHRDRVLVETFLALPTIVASSRCLALVYRRMAEACARSHDIELHAPPFACDPLKVAMYWTPARERDTAHRWLRSAVISAVAEL
jgi:LysR family nod box-dependent transcriptional activator